jgi:hypothetical protein
MIGNSNTGRKPSPPVQNKITATSLEKEGRERM